MGLEAAKMGSELTNMGVKVTLLPGGLCGPHRMP